MPCGAASDNTGLEVALGFVWVRTHIIRESSCLNFLGYLVNIPPMIMYGSGNTSSEENPVCLSAKVRCAESGTKYPRAPSQSASDGLKPYFAPSHWMFKPLPLETERSFVDAFEGDSRSRVVRLRAAGRFML